MIMRYRCVVFKNEEQAVKLYVSRSPETDDIETALGHLAELAHKFKEPYTTLLVSSDSARRYFS